jgi:hypothetical protein
VARVGTGTHIDCISYADFIDGLKVQSHFTLRLHHTLYRTSFLIENTAVSTCYRDHISLRPILSEDVNSHLLSSFERKPNLPQRCLGNNDLHWPYYNCTSSRVRYKLCQQKASSRSARPVSGTPGLCQQYCSTVYQWDTQLRYRYMGIASTRQNATM